MTLQLVLASQSPQRIALIARLGFDVLVQPSGVDETLEALSADPADLALALARLKAEAVAKRHPACLVLGADTLVALDGRALGKPDGATAAQAMLRQLSGRSHAVHTGLALVVPEASRVVDGRHPATLGATISSVVTFHQLADEQIATYIQTGEPFEKAGAYGIQGYGGRLVARLDGCFTNVVGLPVCAVATLLTAATGQTVQCPVDGGCRIGGEPRCLCLKT
jgi:septum formation protein